VRRARDLLGHRVTALYDGTRIDELSGGQRQLRQHRFRRWRCSHMVILGEAVSALDKSVEAQVINLLLDPEASLADLCLRISHDLVWCVTSATRVMVMYLGQVAEIGASTHVVHRAATVHRCAAVVHPVDGPRPPDRGCAALAGDP
jgi:peptide/nickel transport system ATP-binding protein